MADSATPTAPVVIITGAGKGLGRAYAHLLAKQGARVIVNNRTHSGEASHSADRVVEEIRAAGGEACAHYGAAESPATGADLLQTALDRFGRLDAVIANAGVSEGRSFCKQDLEEFARVMDINLMGTVNLLHPIFRHFYEQRRGAIVVSTSAAGLYGEHGLPAYSASKAALIGLMHALAHEGRSHGVRVNALAPFAATQMTEEALPESLKTLMTPESVAPLAAWLVDDACPLNGEIIVCGGQRAALARYLMSDVQRLPETSVDAEEAFNNWWRELDTRAPSHHHTGAVAMFQSFISSHI